MNDEIIEKDLDLEAQIKDHIAYFPLAGASEISGFRSPDSYVFIFFEKAGGRHSVDFVDYEEEDNQVHVSFPGQIHSWKTKAEAKGHKLILSKRFIETKLCNMKFLSLLYNKFPVINIPIEVSRKLSLEFQLMKGELDAEFVNSDVISFRTKIIVSFIKSVIEELEEQELTVTKRHPIILKFMELVEINFTESKSVFFYAEKLAVTPNYLNVLTKKTLGVTAKELIDAHVVLEAKRLLKGSDESIKQIAYNLGFYTIGSFSSYIS